MLPQQIRRVRTKGVQRTVPGHKGDIQVSPCGLHLFSAWLKYPWRCVHPSVAFLTTSSSFFLIWFHFPSLLTPAFLTQEAFKGCSCLGVWSRRWWTISFSVQLENSFVLTRTQRSKNHDTHLSLYRGDLGSTKPSRHHVYCTHNVSLALAAKDTFL